MENKASSTYLDHSGVALGMRERQLVPAGMLAGGYALERVLALPLQQHLSSMFGLVRHIIASFK